MVKIYVPDIECDSCTRLISRKFHDSKISGFDFGMGYVSLDDTAKKDHAISLIRSLGYRADVEPFERKTLSERWRSMRENPDAYQVEFRGLVYGVNIVILLSVLYLLSYFALFRFMPDFPAKYGIWLFYLLISVASIGVALWHFLSYRARVTCMTGMMVGMIFGMQAGMMVGAVLGATNGFFIGALVGMLLGVGVGALTGKCCGVMGVMQGMMAGLMGGTMGPMISVMMLFDNIHIFMPVYMVINLVIVAGLSYLFYEEVVEKGEGVKVVPIDFVTLASACIITFSVLTALIIYGPKAVGFA